MSPSETARPRKADVPARAPAPAEAGPNAGQAIAQGVRDAFTPLMRFMELVGGHVQMAARAFVWMLRPPARIGNYIDAAEYIGFGSLPIVLLVGAFTGMVTALQSVSAFRPFGLETLAGGTTGNAIAVELGPVLTSLMLAGRVGAGIATELGTMRITEQIDALESMAVNPIQFLVTPRLLAGTLVAPILALLFWVVGMGGAYLSAVIILGVDHGQFVFNLKEFVLPVDLAQGLIKSAIFGFVVVLIGCYQGFNASGGGRGVGMGTTRAVVYGSVMVLVTDYFVTEVLLAILPKDR
ncbi:MAG TPA: ABC transporter permease [Kofleriaceae bacterium]|nr:ABC transporter permease [Kofleriaceae bacterium]